MSRLFVRGLYSGVLLAISGGATALAQSAPVVSAVSASQRPDDSKMVDIRYSLADESLCTVWVRISGDGGLSWDVPAQTFLPGSAIGPNVTPGSNKTIVWDAGADIPGIVGDFSVRVYADDGNGQANMVFVPAGAFPSGGGVPIYVAGFWIDKYEVTNQRYCEFLNAADPAGDHWAGSMEITKSGTTYAVHAGRQNYPVRYVGWQDDVAFAEWLSQRENRNYRLPTETEWEKAAAWDPVEQRLYDYGFHSDSIDCSQCNFNPSPSCVGDTTPVGSYPGSSFYGCYDMSGNVEEQTSSIYGGSAYATKGGSFMRNASECTTTFRSYDPTGGGQNYLGFRLVLDLE